MQTALALRPWLGLVVRRNIRCGGFFSRWCVCSLWLQQESQQLERELTLRNMLALRAELLLRQPAHGGELSIE
jgi:hypothetical protein